MCDACICCGTPATGLNIVVCACVLNGIPNYSFCVILRVECVCHVLGQNTLLFCVRSCEP